MNIPNSRLVRSTTIVKDDDELRVIQFLKKYNATIKTYDITVKADELKIPPLVTR
jgi:hypothetical protein